MDNNAILWKRWYDNAEKKPDIDAIVHMVAGEEPFRWTFSTLISMAEVFSAALIENGIKSGEVCGIIMRHNPYFYPLYLAVDNIGAIPAVLAYPNPRLHPEKFRQGIEGMSRHSGLDWILTERELEQTIKPSIEKPGSSIKGIFFPLEWNRDIKIGKIQKDKFIKIHSEMSSSSPLLLQHSSGTTGLQKPVLLSHRAVLKHIDNYSKAINLTDQDKIVSWLPLYHDMGLIAAFHLPLAFGITSIQLDPFEWVLFPLLLLEAISQEKATITWLPNFAFNILADKIHDDELEGIKLESMRLFINCSEPIRYDSFNKFYSKFRYHGVKRTTFSSSFGMAEATFAVTQNEPGIEPSFVLADRLELAKGKVKLNSNPIQARICVSSGKLINGCSIKIVDENQKEIKENEVGEILVKSDSLFDGYRNYPDKTAEVLKDGWYYSGDYGFRYNDEYFIIGRKKDIIIVAGNNIYPEDIEDVVSNIKGIIPGRVIAFGEEDVELGSEQINIIAETNIKDDEEQKKLKMDVIKTCMEIDVTVRKVHFVPPRWLIKSSAGKPSRKANRERILNNEEILWS